MRLKYTAVYLHIILKQLSVFIKKFATNVGKLLIIKYSDARCLPLALKLFEPVPDYLPLSRLYLNMKGLASATVLKVSCPNYRLL
jgi:hypothetical protein